MKKVIKRLLNLFRRKKKRMEIINIKYHDGHFPAGTIQEYP